MIAAVLLSLIISASAQTEGDVCLTREPSLNHKNIGRLDIFLNGKWGTFCNISKGGAQAACQQIGYANFHEYLPYHQSIWEIPKATEDIPIAIQTTYCDTDEGKLHILRCNYSINIQPYCSHNNDVVLVCKEPHLWSDPYNGQVRLRYTTYSSKGILKIYNYSLLSWGNICFDHFSQSAGDTACRQIGYTNAKAISGVTTNTTDMKFLNGADCANGQSCQCFAYCFEKPKAVSSCGSNKYVDLQCTFNISIAKTATPGGKEICSGDISVSCYKYTSDDILLTVAFVIILLLIVTIVIGIVAVVMICCCVPSCYIAKWRKRSTYKPI